MSLRVKTDSTVLKREIRLHKLVCTHPGIVTIRRSLVEGPFQLLIMDYYADGDLFYQITQCHRYFGEVDLIRDVYLQIVDAVSYCHSLGVFHRDLKPENILCRAGGTKVVVADFGLATLDVVSTDLRVGSAYYISPECNSGPLYSTPGMTFGL
ncbi:hypothetical protein BS47DRAFT_1417292 [Hydnum rufescens UP504]|uniref:Protein kinase domain-containing protein n=1 Tax=Hydnum rufescens UP504 TaxID=1448309 RepID=A0A9P6ALY0_9AGAM|nr:hypothetical protein BS47DRAFT_1417292 [Hydnum rufescens UP504]